MDGFFKLEEYDVALITRNSLKPCLKECLESIYKEISLHHLIVVDDFSTDGTVELVKRYPSVNLIQRETNRGEARQISIENADRDLIFVDSDIVLQPGWLWEITKIMESHPKWGMIWGNALPQLKNEIDRVRTVARMYRMDYLTFNARQGRRGFTHDSVIKLKAIQGIRIPKELHSYEDSYIKRYVESKGYEYLIAKNALALHFTRPRNRNQEMALFASNVVKYGNINSLKIFLTIPLYVMQSAFVLIASGNREEARYSLTSSLKFFWYSLKRSNYTRRYNLGL